MVLTAVAGPRGRRILLLCALALTGLHFLWLTAHLAPAIMSPDAHGYIVQARLIAQEGRTSFSPTSPVQFVGMHWLETEDGVFHSRYPAGLPLIHAAAWKIGGLAAALLVNPVFASATVLLVFLLARRLMDERFALLAATVMALIPVANQHALDADAHVAAAFFLVSGVLAWLRFERTRGWAAGGLAGVLLGAIPSIRYPEAIVGLTIGGWLLWRVRPVWRAWPALAGAAVPLGALLAQNAAAYGAFWKTGYALTNEQTGFGADYFVAHVLPYLQGLGGQGLALMFAFGAAGLAGLVAEPCRRPEGVLFAGMVVPLVLLYMAYYFGGGGAMGAAGNLRFLIPTFPFFAVAAAWLLARLAAQPGAAGRAAVGTVVALQLVMGMGGSRQVLARAKASLGAAARARAVAERQIPAGAVLILDRQLAESFDASGRWKLVEESLVAGGGPGAAGFAGPRGPVERGGPGGRGLVFRPGGTGGPPGLDTAGDTPSPRQPGKNRAQRERFAGLGPEERRARVWHDLAAWAHDRPVYWFARSVDVVREAVPEGAAVNVIAEVNAPVMFGPGAGAAPGAPMPGRGPGPGRGAGFSRGMGPMDATRAMAPESGAGDAADFGALRRPRGGGMSFPASKLRIVQIDLAR